MRLLLVTAEGDLCMACGELADRCPVCRGAGEVMVRDERALARARRPRLDPDDAYDYPETCGHCGGTGRHVCAHHDCDCCGRAAEFFWREVGVHLCHDCANAE